MDTRKLTSRGKSISPEARKLLMRNRGPGQVTCQWCDKTIEPADAKVPDIEPGQFLHLHCSVEIADGDDIDKFW